LAALLDVVGSGVFSDQLLSEGVTMKTLYDLLGVPCDVDDGTLNKAYRNAAKACHPDLNVGDPNASNRSTRSQLLLKSFATRRRARLMTDCWTTNVSGAG
jgi:hypothetical protein